MVMDKMEENVLCLWKWILQIIFRILYTKAKKL